MSQSIISYQSIIDISQPVTATTACFPGDTPFSKQVTVSFDQSKVINLTAFTMSPHVGSHADAPVHIKGSLPGDDTTAGAMHLDAFIGPALVIDCATTREPLTKSLVEPHLSKHPEIKRVLLRTLDKVDAEAFESDYAYIATDLASYLGECGIKLVGLDTPSVDHIRAKELTTHKILDSYGLVWLENLDLSQVQAGIYQLIALPLKFMELEASPVRAVLLR